MKIHDLFFDLLGACILLAVLWAVISLIILCL